MKTLFSFFSSIFQQPLWVILWVHVLVIINMLSLMFFEHALAQWIFAIFVLQALVMVLLFARFGYEKILGAAHFLWPPLLIYIYATLPEYSAAFYGYLVVLSLVNLVSLLFDVYDLFIYIKVRRNGYS